MFNLNDHFGVKNSLLNTVTVLLLLISLSTQSGSDHHHQETQNHDAHTHGEADLTLAKEGDELLIRFESPASNILGFEHTADSEQEIAAVWQARKQLASPEVLFTFDGSKCSIASIDIDTSGVMNVEQTHQGHDKEHDDHGEKIHDENHSEIVVDYRFNCTNGSELASVSTGLFKSFSGIEKITVNWVTEDKQGAAILRAGQTKIVFK